MEKEKRIAYAARFGPRIYQQIFAEALERGVSIRQILDDSVNLYFNSKGSPLWQKTLSSGQN